MNARKDEEAADAPHPDHRGMGRTSFRLNLTAAVLGGLLALFAAGLAYSLRGC